MSDANPLYDLIIIGGGVNGAGIARDASGRGAKTLLLEQGDLARGTSSASTKLIHGGLRYLEHYEFGLVREALSERERLWSIAPHIIWPLRFVLPYQRGLRPRWLLRLGLFLYDHIGGRKLLPTTKTINLRTHLAGQTLKLGFVTGFEYSDGWVDDARLVVLNALDAAELGAEVRTRTEVTRLTRTNSKWSVETFDSDGREQVFEGRCVVNAAGPSVLNILNRADMTTKQKMRLVQGSHIVVNRLFDHNYAYFFQLSDGRIFFAIPYERDYTLIGTTDKEYSGSISEPRASADEIAYLCDGANMYFKTQITPEDVVWTYSGVRPLLDNGSGKPEAATRGYLIDISEEKDGAPLLTVFGGKITSYRHLSETAVDMLSTRIENLSDVHWTAEKALPGGDFPMTGAADLARQYSSEFPFLKPETVDRIVKAYGSRAQVWLPAAEQSEDIGHGLTVAEVDYLIQFEWAKTADDILWRRSKLGLKFTPLETSKLINYIDKRAR